MWCALPKKMTEASDSRRQQRGAARMCSCMAPLPNHRLPSIRSGPEPLSLTEWLIQTCTFCAVIFGAQVHLGCVSFLAVPLVLLTGRGLWSHVENRESRQAPQSPDGGSF